MWGEQVGVGQLVLVAAKVFNFQQALVDKRLQAKVGFAQADAQGFGQFALVEVGVGLKLAQDLEMDLVVQGIVFGHWKPVYTRYRRAV